MMETGGEARQIIPQTEIEGAESQRRKIAINNAAKRLAAIFRGGSVSILRRRSNVSKRY